MLFRKVACTASGVGVYKGVMASRDLDPRQHCIYTFLEINEFRVLQQKVFIVWTLYDRISDIFSR